MKKYMSIISLIVCIVMIFTFVACGEEVVNDNNNEINNTINDENDNNEINNTVNIENEEVNNESNADITDPYSAPEVDIPENHDMSIHYTINYMGRNTNNADIDKYSFVKDALEDMFNITFDFSPGTGTNNDMELIAAADAVPECAWIYLGSTEKAWTLYRDGLTRSIPMDYVQKYAPYMWLAMQDDKSFHPTQLVPGTEDEYFTLFANRYGMYELGSGTAVRLDWLENLGIAPKGDLDTIVEDNVYITDEAYLLNEFSDLLYDFTFSDPDMNGENDTFGLDTYGLRADDFSYGGTLYAAFSMKNTYTPDENGWAVPLIFSEANFKFFKQLGEWNKMGVLPNGFETKTVSDWENMWASGKYGATAFEQKTLSVNVEKLSDSFVNEYVPLVVFNNNPDAKIILTPPLLDNDGTGGHGRSYGDYIRAPGAGYFYVRDDVSDEKLKRILMVYDYMSCNPDGRWFCLFGVQNIHWGYDEKNNRITLPQDDLPDNLKWEAPGYFMTPCVANSDIITSFIAPKSNNEGTFLNVRTAMSQFSKENWLSLGYTYVEADMPGDWGEGLEWTDPANTRAKNNVYKDARTALINETADPDTVWDNLMNTLNNFGYQEYLVALNNNVYLRDELFFDGVGVTPAEKFPLD